MVHWLYIDGIQEDIGHEHINWDRGDSKLILDHPSGAGDGANIFTPSINDSIGWKWLLVRPDEGTFFIIRSSSHKPYNHRQWDKLDGDIIQGSIVWNTVGDLSVALRGARAKVDTNTSR